jgi:hypothetical protein
MSKRKSILMFVLAGLLLVTMSGVVLADGPITDEEPQPASPPPSGVRVYTVTETPRGGLSGPGGGYAVLSAIMNYYQQGWSWYARAGADIDLVSGTSYAWAYATLKKYGWSSPTSNCYASGTGGCTTYTSYYSASGQMTAQADTTVYWSAGGSSSASAFAYHTF